MTTLPTDVTAGATTGHVSHHNQLATEYAEDGGTLPSTMVAGQNGHDTSHHPALRAWYNAANPGTPLAALPARSDPGYGAAHDAHHEALHAWVNQRNSAPPFVAAQSTNDRYLVDQYGAPVTSFFDTIWPMVQLAGRDGASWQADMHHWVTTRAGQGMTGLKWNLFGNAISGVDADLLTYDNVSPFNTTNPATADPTQFNETYWTRVDYLIDQAAAAGLTCWIHIIYKDDVSAPSGTGWMQGHSNAEYTSFGTILANRYKNRPNIVWVYGGDYFDESWQQMEMLADAMTAAGDTHLVTVQNHSDSANGTFWTTSRKHSNGSTMNLGTAVATVEGLYTYARLYESAQTAWETAPTMPIVYYDGYYWGGSGNDLRLRRDMGWMLTCATYASHMGSEALWYQPVGWRNNLTAPTQLVALLGAFEALTGWHTLVPDWAGTFVTAGRSSGDTRVTAAKNAAGTLAVIYMPAANNTITVATAQMVSGYTARWVDPANGSSVAGTTGTSFSRGTANSAAGADWLLVLEGP